MASLVVVVGNPKPASRTRKVAEAVADALIPLLPEPVESRTIDLADCAGELFDWGSPTVGELNELVARADVAVFASPTYKATYTGLLKAFLDRYGSNGLAGLIAVPVMTAAAAVHGLAVEAYLRPLLVELGASVPSRGLFVTESHIDDPAGPIDAWMSSARPLLLPVFRSLVAGVEARGPELGA